MTRETVPILSILRPQTERKFRARLQQDGDCLVFTGTCTRGGYGLVAVMRPDNVRVNILTHRLAWALANGVDPPEGMMVCHRCNRPPCCNADHLYLGTAKDNSAYMIECGRHSRAKPLLGRIGSAHPRAHPKELRDRVLAMVQADFESGKGISFLRVSRYTGVMYNTISKWWRQAHPDW